MTTATLAPITSTVTVGVPIEKAFEVFTTRFNSWWPQDYHIGGAEMAEAVLEPRAGGRWYERGVDGSECEWGKVLAWEPPHRVVLAWHTGADWQHNPDPACASEVSVSFTAIGPKETQVELVHRHIERHGAGADEMRTSMDSGWHGIMQGYAAVAQEA